MVQEYKKKKLAFTIAFWLKMKKSGRRSGPARFMEVKYDLMSPVLNSAGAQAEHGNNQNAVKKDFKCGHVFLLLEKIIRCVIRVRRI